MLALSPAIAAYDDYRVDQYCVRVGRRVIFTQPGPETDTVVLDLPERPLSELRADGRMLKQILINLLSNAVRLTPHGGRIDIIARSFTVDGFMIQVSDTGIGIDAEDIPKALARFQQVDGKVHRR